MARILGRNPDSAMGWLALAEYCELRYCVFVGSVS